MSDTTTTDGTNPSAMDSAAPTEAEYPAHIWPRIYALVLGVLLLDIVVFAALTRYFS